MIAKKILISTVIISAIFSAASAYSSSFEMKQSSRCNRYFPIYEEKHHMPSNLLRAVSVTESGKWVKVINKNVAWPWTINVGGKGYHFNSKAQAIKAVKNYMAKGKKSIDVGCMQINLKYHPEAFRNLEQAFEPRYNVAYAAKFLTNKYKRQGSWETAIRHYHNVKPKFSNKYIARVYDVWRKEDRAVNVALLDTPAMNITVKPRPERASNDVSGVTASALETFVQ